MILTHWIAYEKSCGFKPGDILRDKNSGNLYRYIGVYKNGIPKTRYNKDIPIFEEALPKTHLESQKRSFFLATEKSSSLGYLNPKEEKLPESIEFLDLEIEDLKKIGNISNDLWMFLCEYAWRQSEEGKKYLKALESAIPIRL